jgi:ABC-type nitrate/sulfonate/bicarbonate transport system substrate-binding protein
MARVKRFALLLFVILVVPAIVVGSFFYLNSLKLYDGSMESITLGATLLESTGPAFVAEERHFFTDNGLNVTMKYYDVGLNAVNAMQKGEVDLALCAEYILVGKALGDQRIQTIGSVAKTEFASVVGRKDRGIDNISDLHGKRIGVVRGTVMEFYLGRFLELHGLRISDETLVNITLAQSADVIINGDVDAVISFPPYVETAQQQLGDNAVVWAAQSGQMLYGLITCRTEWVTQHPELVKRFLNAVSQTEDYMVQHTNEAKTIVQKTMNFTDDYMTVVWSRNDFSLSLDQSLVVVMESETRWMINNNLTNQSVVPDFLYYIYREGLNSVKPESVNLIH